MRNIMIAIALSFATLTTMVAVPALAQTKTVKGNSWDGTWSGTSSAGGKTTVKIANGKVTLWTNNGFPRPKAVGSVSGNSVSLDDKNGWKATITPHGEGKARITASGIGNNGKPARNTAVLLKQ